MIKHFYICHKDAVHQNKDSFKECHWIDLNEQGEVLVTAKFLHEGMEINFRKSHASIQRLPHMLSRKPVHPDHVKKLNDHLGHLIQVDPNDSMFDLAEKLGEHFPLHGPESF